MEDKDEMKNSQENNFSEEPPKFYFPSELEGAPKKDEKAPPPAPRQEYHPSMPTNIFGNSTILNIPELKKDESEPGEAEPSVDSIYDGPPRSKKIVLRLIPIVALVLVLATVLTAVLVVMKLNEPDRSEYLFDMMGLLAVQKSESPMLWGYINKSGELVIDYQFLDAAPFSESGLAAVKVVNGARWGYINRNGELVIDAEFSDAKPFDEKGIAVVRNDDHFYGMIDKSGDYIVEPEYKSLSPFNEFGLAYATKSKLNNGVEVGLIDRRGYEFIDLKANYISAFSTDGYASADRNKLIDKNGDIIKIRKKDSKGTDTELPISSVQSPLYDQKFFANDLVWVCVNGKYGYADDKFEIAIDCKFNMATAFSDNGLAGVQFEDGTYGYINKKGETVISLAEYQGISQIEDFSSNWARVTFGGSDGSDLSDSSVLYGGNKINFVNKNGEFLFDEPLPMGSNIVYRFDDLIGILSRESGGKFTAYDENGDIAWQITPNEGEVMGSIQILEENIFVVSGKRNLIYGQNGELIADLSEYGKDHEYFFYAGDASDHVIFLAYNNGTLPEAQYFVFDKMGKLIMNSDLSTLSVPQFFADGYVILQSDAGAALCELENGELTEIIKVKGVKAYSSVESYFSSGRNGGGYYFGSSGVYVPGLFRSSTSYPVIYE